MSTPPVSPGFVSNQVLEAEHLNQTFVAKQDWPAITEPPGTNDTSVATTEFVQTAIAAHGIPQGDAPSDGNWYGRQNAAWSQVVPMAGPNNTVTIGYHAGAGSSNVNIGYGASYSLTTGSYNTNIGYLTGYALTSGYNNTFFGYQAGYNITTGWNNVVIGYAAGSAIVAGANNIVIGAGATIGGDKSSYISIGNWIQGDMDGSHGNVSIGHNSGNTAAVTGGYNINIGQNAGAALTTGAFNANLGYNAGSGITTGAYNVNLGCGTGTAMAGGIFNVAIGYLAGQSVSVSHTTNVGAYAGWSQTTAGDGNTNIGCYTGQNAVGATGLVNVGFNAGSQISSGSSNTNIGYYAGFATTIGGSNTFVGGYAGTSLTTGNSNTAIGIYAGNSETTGSYNVNIGEESGYNAVGVSSNVNIGSKAGISNVSGSSNINIGYNTNAPTTSTSNYLNIGGAITGQMNTGPLSSNVNFQISPPTGNNAVLILNAPAVTNVAQITWMKASSIRWVTRVVGAEGGSNAGSNFNLDAYSDAGTSLHLAAVSIARATGAVSLTNSLGIFGTVPPATQPTITGAKGGNAALASLIAALVSYGLIIDSTTA
jgi:hypothetical protein